MIFTLCIIVIPCMHAIFILEDEGHLRVISGFGQENFKNFYFHN